MCPSSWKLYVDDFPFFSSSLAHLEPELELFEVWETMVGQIITIIANVIMWRLEQNVTITIVVQQWSHRSDHCQRLRSRKEISTSTADSPAVHFSVLSWWCSIPRTEPPPSAANNFTALYFRALLCTLHSSLIQRTKTPSSQNIHYPCSQCLWQCFPYWNNFIRGMDG